MNSERYDQIREWLWSYYQPKNADKPNKIMQVIQLSSFQVKSAVAARCVPNLPQSS